ncbi:dioxygenase [Pseudothermotoga hypogea DSM 11164 = NBRC 106472]|uniref:Dioxygenase n=1 Tax=Pseudothermotoga hypogea DSM 11164 = NBRC 106472 TaxID=1123384 RepID=A0A0X1KRG7_9THEM|nr:MULTISPECIES: OAM dimerization domain-containing protein [Pseudothermotoga]AJC73916.1 dioxygenase [Pseudothermotoga hypogea DSM 11164 = NBRC 106472]MBC7122163.1 cobalamin B12-binding domain-containing protein [Pseudothermotoga sp.]MDI6862156.1 OAM dimerization domain-containing protein [Pseudothermotoga sp.]
MSQQKLVKPYGDQLNDGAVQLSFTLPIEFGPLAREAAKKFCEKLGFYEVTIATMEDLHEGYTFFVVYGKTDMAVDISSIKVIAPKIQRLPREKIDELVLQKFRRPIVVVGATIGTDAHTVGLDSILNMKGFHGDYGLERYKAFKVYNLGAQVPPIELVRKVREVGADVVLVSQVVTQRNIHIQHLTELMELLYAENLRDNLLVIVGGPRITHELALELGYDAGFGSGTTPSEVANFIVQELLKRRGL